MELLGFVSILGLPLGHLKASVVVVKAVDVVAVHHPTVMQGPMLHHLLLVLVRASQEF